MQQIFSMLGHSWMCAYSVVTRLELSCWWEKDSWVEYTQEYESCAVRPFGFLPDLWGHLYFKRGFPGLLLMRIYLKLLNMPIWGRQFQIWAIYVSSGAVQAWFCFPIKQISTQREVLQDMLGGIAKGILLCYAKPHLPLTLKEALGIKAPVFAFSRDNVSWADLVWTPYSPAAFSPRNKAANGSNSAKGTLLLQRYTSTYQLYSFNARPVHTLFLFWSFYEHEEPITVDGSTSVRVAARCSMTLDRQSFHGKPCPAGGWFECASFLLFYGGHQAVQNNASERSETLTSPHNGTVGFWPLQTPRFSEDYREM